MIRFVPETASTNADIASALAGGGYWAEGDWIVADRQTDGRGRLGREWHGGLGNFMGSTVVHLQHGDPVPASLSLLTGLALHEAVGRLLVPGTPLMLKWPNDVLLDGAKAAGILLEAIKGFVIVGIGVNLLEAPELADRKTAALSDFGAAPDRDAFAVTLAGAFERELHRWRTAGLAPMLRRWQSAAHPVGTRLTVLPPGEDALSGEFAGLADDGNLRLRLGDGTVRTVHAGDVLLQPTSVTGNR